MVPYRTYHKHIPQDDENMIGAVAYPGRMSEAEDRSRVLRRRRNVPYSKPDNFGISSAQQIADQFRQITASVRASYSPSVPLDFSSVASG